MRSKLKLVPAGLLALALALPATALAHPQEAAQTVRQHTNRADAGLDRAVALFEAGKQRRADRALDRSRRQMGQARREARAVIGDIDGLRDRARAARAVKILASEQDENVEELVGALEDAHSKVENAVAKAALQDTRGREKAIAILDVLLNHLPDRAQAHISHAIARLSIDRDAEVAAGTQALASGEVSGSAKRGVARTVATNVDGQSHAGATLSELIASSDIPDAAKEGLQRAYDAVVAELGSASEALAQLPEQVPARIVAFLEAKADDVAAAVQELLDNLPADLPEPPSGP